MVFLEKMRKNGAGSKTRDTPRRMTAAYDGPMTASYDDRMTAA
jgi:hypothetical protein